MAKKRKCKKIKKVPRRKARRRRSREFPPSVGTPMRGGPGQGGYLLQS